MPDKTTTPTRAPATIPTTVPAEGPLLESESAADDASELLTLLLSEAVMAAEAVTIDVKIGRDVGVVVVSDVRAVVVSKRVVLDEVSTSSDVDVGMEEVVSIEEKEVEVEVVSTVVVITLSTVDDERVEVVVGDVVGSEVDVGVVDVLGTEAVLRVERDVAELGNGVRRWREQHYYDQHVVR
jgi:hypothetical protein